MSICDVTIRIFNYFSFLLIVSQQHILVLNRICAVDYFVSRKHRDPNAVSVKPPENNILPGQKKFPRAKPKDSTPKINSNPLMGTQRMPHGKYNKHGIKDGLIDTTAHGPQFINVRMPVNPTNPAPYMVVTGKDMAGLAGTPHHTQHHGAHGQGQANQPMYYTNNGPINTGQSSQSSGQRSNAPSAIIYPNYSPQDNVYHNMGLPIYPSINQSNNYQNYVVQQPQTNFDYQGHGQNNNKK
jgi:hypothetical protein